MAKEGSDTLSLKLLVDKHGKRVLFVEAGKDFVDFLFHIMTLPARTVMRLLKNNGLVVCVGNLYRCIQNISHVYMKSATDKEALLKPKSPSCGACFPLLLADSSPSARKTYNKCTVEGNGGRRSKFHSCCPNIVDHPNATCAQSNTFMTRQVILLEEQQVKLSTILSSGDVKVVNQFSVKYIGALEEKALGMLKTSLYSKNVLINIFLCNPSS